MSKFITKVTFKTTPYGKKETRTPHFAPPKRQKIYTYSIFKDVVSERNELQVSGKKKLLPRRHIKTTKTPRLRTRTADLKCFESN